MQKLQTPIEIALGIDAEGNTTARKLYEFLELEPSNYSRWTKTNITNNSFAVENEDYFYSSSMKSENRGNFAEDYKLTSQFAKKLAMKAGGPRGEEAREYFTKVEEKTKEIAIQRSQLSPQMKSLFMMVESMAQMEIEQTRQAKQITALETKITDIENQTQYYNGYYSVTGYAAKHKIKCPLELSKEVGRCASRISRTLNIKMGSIPDSKWGSVHTYHEDVLREAFEEVLSNEA